MQLSQRNKGNEWNWIAEIHSEIQNNYVAEYRFKSESNSLSEDFDVNNIRIIYSLFRTFEISISMEELIEYITSKMELNISIKWEQKKITLFHQRIIPSGLMQFELSQKGFNYVDANAKYNRKDGFQKGDAVVCIDDSFEPEAYIHKLPKFGSIYTISEVYSLGICLSNYSDSNQPSGDNNKIGFYKRRFVSLDDFIRSISIEHLSFFLRNVYQPWIIRQRFDRNSNNIF